MVDVKKFLVLMVLVLAGVGIFAQNVGVGMEFWQTIVLNYNCPSVKLSLSEGQVGVIKFVDKGCVGKDVLDANSSIFTVTDQNALYFSWSSISEQICDFKLKVGSDLWDINGGTNFVYDNRLLPGELVGLQVSNNIASGDYNSSFCRLTFNDLNVA